MKFAVFRVAEFQGDLIAGCTIGMTVIPQAIAYAGIAGVPPQVFCFIYFFKHRHAHDQIPLGLHGDEYISMLPTRRIHLQGYEQFTHIAYMVHCTSRIAFICIQVKQFGSLFYAAFILEIGSNLQTSKYIVGLASVRLLSQLEQKSSDCEYNDSTSFAQICSAM